MTGQDRPAERQWRCTKALEEHLLRLVENDALRHVCRQRWMGTCARPFPLSPGLVQRHGRVVSFTPELTKRRSGSLLLRAHDADTKRIGLFTLFGIAPVSGCTINRDIMFKTADDYEFAEFSDTSRYGTCSLQAERHDPVPVVRQRWLQDDRSGIRRRHAGGHRFIQRSGTSSTSWTTTVLVKLPLLGRVQLGGHDLA